MSNIKGLVILGFGGHARSVADVALSIGYNSLLFIDENAKLGETFFGHQVLQKIPAVISDSWEYMPAAGDNFKRQMQTEFINSRQKLLATIVSNNATIGLGVEISSGCFIAHHVHLGPMVVIGKGCLINTGAVVEHDCIIGEFSHLSVNSTIAGKSRVGNLVLVGAGAVVIDNISVTNKVTIGAGGVVVKNIYESGTYVGLPAKLLNSRTG